jgi:hypothetical protein
VEVGTGLDSRFLGVTLASSSAGRHGASGGDVDDTKD